MKNRIAVLGCLLLTPSVLTAEAPRPEPAWERPDALGRPVPWSAEVHGQRVSLRLPYRHLQFGQPIKVRLETAQTEEKPPYLRLHFQEPWQTVYLEWTNEHGEGVTFRRQVSIGGGSGAGVSGNVEFFRLQPTGKFASGQYLVPGKYRLRAVIDARRNPSDPKGWVGRIESPTFEFTVVDVPVRDRSLLVPESIRARVITLLRALDDPKVERRDQAERELEKIGVDALPLIETGLSSPAEEVRARTHALFRKLTRPAVQPRTLQYTHEATAPLCPLGEAGWRVVAENLEPEALDMYRTEAAWLGPVEPLTKRDLQDPQTVRRLVAELNHEKPYIRMKALRSLPRTDNPQILAALVRRMNDNYGYYRHFTISHAVPEQVLATEARLYAIPWQGKNAIGPVIDWMKQVPEDYAREVYGPELLGKLGPDTRSLAILGQRVGVGSHNERHAIVPALGRLGRDAVPILVKVASDREQNGIIRRMAIEEMRQHGDARTVGPTLLAMMQETDPQLVYAAIQTAEAVRLREALPVFKRLALDEKTEQNVRSWAICAYARMADRQEVEALLLALLQSPSTSAAGNAAHMLAALECRAAVPRLLDLLSHADWYVRAKADEALRGLAKKPEGVGFDTRKPDPAAWREWWQDKR